MLQINGIDIPTPSSYKVGIEDLVKAERNANGTLIKEIIATKRKIELVYNYLTQSDVASVLTLVGNNTFTVTYVDPINGDGATGTFYSGGRSVSAIDYQNGVMRYKDIRFNLIEV